LSHLLSLFPVDFDMTLEANAYNNKMHSHIENIRDFQLAHYHLNGRSSEGFWDYYKQIEIPQRLQYKLTTFKARGVVTMYENETFQEASWRYLFTGAGIMPKTYDPLVDKMAEGEQIEHFQKMLRFLAYEAEQMPDQQTYIDINSDDKGFNDSIF